MTKSFMIAARVCFARLMSSMFVVLFTLVSPASAHEVLPAIADMEQKADQLTFDIRLNIESMMAGVDLTEVTDTNQSAQAGDYDALRALPAEELQNRFAAFWPQMAENIIIETDKGRVVPVLIGMQADPVGDTEVTRASRLQFAATLPADSTTVQVGWAGAYGTLVIRQMGVDAPYDGYLEAGALSDPIRLSGGDQATGWQTFVNYIPVGFDHIVPKGLDHILFVLGLFFLSTHLRPLLAQVSLFTLAHTITLALAALGYVSISGKIVEPLIAASIVFVAVENIWARGISRSRPFVVFGFGLLHGLGFAAVLGEFGLPAGSFIPALIGFNVGVELGQLAVIAVMFACVWQAVRIDRGANEVAQGRVLYGVLILAAVALIALNPAGLVQALENPVIIFLGPLLGIFALCIASITFRDHLSAYRRIVSIPASVAIAVVGAYWFIERVFL